jgi:putative Mg2+ transporter-C (MgtC) family protein
MPVTIGWEEIAWRLALTVLGGALLGTNRSERGRTAGLRTTILVCLAASVSMIQVNLLLGLSGKASDSFIVMDLMRLPLGILTGMGFIGAGAILRKGTLIRGVTTAATLWLATAIGLCFGGGQNGLGVVTVVVGIGTLWGLAPLENSLPRQHRALLTLVCTRESAAASHILSELSTKGYQARSLVDAFEVGGGDNVRHTKRWEVEWRGRSVATEPPVFLEQSARLPGVLALTWKLQGN